MLVWPVSGGCYPPWHLIRVCSAPVLYVFATDFWFWLLFLITTYNYPTCTRIQFPENEFYECIQSLSKSIEIMCLLKESILKENIKKITKNILLCFFCNNSDIIYWTPTVKASRVYHKLYTYMDELAQFCENRTKNNIILV